MSTINDLSTGNKLSLKGKIFELQRKLSLIDLEKKIVEEYPFQPTFYSQHEKRRKSTVSGAKSIDSSSGDDYSKPKFGRKVSDCYESISAHVSLLLQGVCT